MFSSKFIIKMNALKCGVQCYKMSLLERITRNLKSMAEIKIPRNFKLLMELEKGEKGIDGDHNISYGLRDPLDSDFDNWTATIVGPGHTSYENRIYTIQIYCPENYPEYPPKLRFQSRINLPCVDSKGWVIPDTLDYLKNWKRDNSFEEILKAIRKQMSFFVGKKLQQPPENSKYEWVENGLN